ncbi:MAG: methyltransferase domain-containing protein [Verrucomicrobiae bacterium]|nr:methyltransferase domain-containing protein [Verrucomicrobiae bacterium]
MLPSLSAAESRYIEKRRPTGRPQAQRAPSAAEPGLTPPAEFGGNAEWLRLLSQDLPKFIPFLTRKCGVEFRGRILEVSAGVAWFSAELSKLPRVVEVIATDYLAETLKHQAPQVFKLLRAHEAKITRMPADLHRLDFPDNYFDFVVCSAGLHRAVNLPQLLREARRVLKPGGQFVSIREPVCPLVRPSASARRKRTGLISVHDQTPQHTAAEYREFFRRAGLAVVARRVNLASGLKYYFDEAVNGLTHARYAFIGSKRGRA